MLPCLPGEQASSSYLATTRAGRNSWAQPSESISFATYGLFRQVGTPAHHTKPIADILPAV